MKKISIFFLFITLILAQQSESFLTVVSNPQKNIGTCRKYTSDKQSCLECVSHYHLFEGQCYIDIHGCSQYVFGNICRKCEQGFILVNNECCDKHCMAKIFKNYQVANEQTEMTEEQKIQRRISEGYQKTIQVLYSWKVRFTKFSLYSTSNQVLQSYIRYFIKILGNDKPYRCIADFEIDSKKIFILQFRLQSEMSAIKQQIFNQQDVVSNDQARVALQYASGKFGLRTYGASLERVSATTYKYGSEFKLIYISNDLALIIHVVVASAGNKKQPAYSPWSQERKDVQTIKTYVQKSMTVVKMRNVLDLQIIKQCVSQINQIKISEVQIKIIQKVEQGVYKYTFVNQQTKQVFEQISKIDKTTKKIEILERKQIIGKDIQNMKLPQSPEKKIIPKQGVTESPQVKDAIKYLEQVQPSLANNQIVNAAVQTIGENKKITLIQKKNDQTMRVIVLHNQRTNEYRLIDQSLVISTPPIQTIYTNSAEGKPKIITTDVEKFKKNDDQVGQVISTIEKKLPLINTTNIVSFERIDGNLVNTYQVVIKGDKMEQAQQQVTVIQNTETKQVKIIDVGQIPSPILIKPIQRTPNILTQTQYKSSQVKMVIQQLKKTKQQLKDTQIVIKKVNVEETKFVNQYNFVLQTQKGEILYVKANKVHQEKTPQIIYVKQVYENKTKQKKVQETYIQKITVDETTGYKIIITTKPEEIKTSFVTQVLGQVTTTQIKANVEQIQSLVRKEYQNTVTQTAVIRQEQKFVQVTVQQVKKTGQIKKIDEQVVQIKLQQFKPILPVIQTTKISSTTFNQIIKVNAVLQNVTNALIITQPTYQNLIPVTTQIEQTGSIQTITFIFENQVTKQKQRIVAEYNETTQKVIIKQQISLQKVIQKVFYEKDVISTGQTRLISNKIQQINKQDKYITSVVSQITNKIPMVQNNIVRVEVVTNNMTNNYQVTAVNSTTKQAVTVFVSYNKQTDKITLNDIREQTKDILITPKPIQKPVIILTKDQIIQQKFQNILTYVEKQVEVKRVTQVKQIKNTITTEYIVGVQTSTENKTVVVVVDNNNKSDITIIDIKSQQIIISTQNTAASSYTTFVADVTNVQATITNVTTLIQTNKYLKIVSNAAIQKQPKLASQNITCFSEDKFKNTIQVTYIAKVNLINVLVSGIVEISTSNVLWIDVPSVGISSSLTPSIIQTCSDRSQTIMTITKQTIISLSQSNSQIKALINYVYLLYKYDSIDRAVIQKFSSSIKYVVLIYKNKVSLRVVLIYARSTSEFRVIEKPEKIQPQKPLIFEQKIDIYGSKIISSNSLQQVKTVDTRITKFMESLTKQIFIQTNQITNVVSQQNINTNQYTLTVKNQKATVQIKAIFKKEDNSVLVTQYNIQPNQFIAPLVKPVTIVTKQEYTSTKIQKVVEVINNNKKIPNITTENIIQIGVTQSAVTKTYSVITGTSRGNQTFVVIQNIKGQINLIDFKPAIQTYLISPVPQLVKTQYTVNKVSGIETQITNDIKIIKQSTAIKNVVSKLLQQKTISKNTQVISAVTKTSQKIVQAAIVMRSFQKSSENIVVIAVYDKKTNNAIIVEEKKVIAEVNQKITVKDEIVETVYTNTVIQQTINQDVTLQKIIKKVGELNKDVKDLIPTEVVLQKINSKIISTVSYEGKKISTVIYNQKTGQVLQFSSEAAPINIKPLIYEIQRTMEGTTTVWTNSVEKITQANKNFNRIVSEIKLNIPSIQTQKIEGVKIIKSDIVNAAQKIVILFQTQKKNEKAQITVIDQANQQKLVIFDVQTILPEQIIPIPEPVNVVKLSKQQIQIEKIQTIISSNIQELPFKEVKKIVDVNEVKTAYTKIIDIEIVNKNNQTYLVKIQQIGLQERKIIDYVQVTNNTKKQIFTVTTTNPKNGIISTYTNDIKVMADEKTFSKCVDALEKQRNLSKLGFIFDSQTVSRLQRSVEHYIRYVNKQTRQGIDYRVIVDSRTGQISINEETKIAFRNDESFVMPAEKLFLEIPKSLLQDSMSKYTFIQSSLVVLRQADYTFQGKTPELTQIKQYKSNAVYIVMIFKMLFNDVFKKTRVVFLGQQKTAGNGYIMKIIDITTLPDVIPSIQTKVTYDIYNRKTTYTNDVKTLEKNSIEYTKVIDKIQQEISVLSQAQVSSVVIKEYKNVNQYTVMVQKGTQIIQTKVSYHKSTDESVIIDFKTQSNRMQIQRVPIRQVQSIVIQVSKQKLVSQEYTSLQKKIIEQQKFSQETIIKNVKIQQNLKVDTYVIKLVDKNNIESTVTAIKNPNTKQFNIISCVTKQQMNKNQTNMTLVKQSSTTIQIDSVTGTQIVKTDDVKIIKETPIIIGLAQKIQREKIVGKKSKIISAVTKNSQIMTQTTVLIQQESQETVIIAIANKKQPTKVQIISTQVIQKSEQRIYEQQIVEQIVITQTIYKSVIKKDKHLQKIIQTVVNKVPQFTEVVPTRVIMQIIGGKTISEVSYQKKKLTVITDQKQQIIRTYEQQIPIQFFPGIIDTKTTSQGYKKITTTDVSLIQKAQITSKKVISEVTKQFSRQEIKTVISQETSFGKIYTVIAQKEEQIEQQQIIYYYNKETQKIAIMGSQIISTLNLAHTQQRTIKPIPSNQWETQQIKLVINQVTNNVVKYEQITKVQQFQQTSNYKFYQVSYNNQAGSQVAKITVNKLTKQILLIDTQSEHILISPQPVEPSQTNITIDETTGIETIISTNIQNIQSEATFFNVKNVITNQITSLQEATVVSKVTFDYNLTIQQRFLFKQKDSITQVVTIIDKNTQQITIYDSFKVDSTIPLVNQQVVTESLISQMMVSDVSFNATIIFLQKRYIQLKQLMPYSVKLQELKRTIKYIVMFKYNALDTRIVVIYNKLTKQFSIIDEPSKVSVVKPLIFEITITQQNRTIYFSTNVETIDKYDSNFGSMFNSLSSTVSIETTEISSIMSTQTYTGNSYTIITTQGTDINQINVYYNQQNKQIKIIGMQTVPNQLICPAPTPRPIIIISRQDYTSQKIATIIQTSMKELNVDKFTVSQIISIKQVKTLYGQNYIFEINTTLGVAVLTTAVSGSSVTLISYNAPAQPNKPTQPTFLISQAPITTQFAIDAVTGIQIQITNDTSIIKESLIIKNIVAELTQSSSISMASEIISVSTKTTLDHTYTTMVVKDVEQSKVIVTITDHKNNSVTLIAEKPIPKQIIGLANIAALVPQTIITSSIYDEVIKKDINLQTVIKQIIVNHPDIQQSKPIKVVIQKIGQKTVTEVDYKNMAVIVVYDQITKQTKQVSYSSLPKQSQRKSIVIQQKVTTQGTKIITSNKIEQIQIIVPIIRPAITEIIKILPIKIQQIKTISTIVQQKQFTIITVDQTNKVKEIKFIYQPEKSKPIIIIDVQQFSEPVIPIKPKQIVYEQVIIQQQQEIIKAVQILNKTNSVIKNEVTQIVKVEKAITNFVQQYKVQVKTETSEEASIVFEIDSTTQQAVLIDIIRFIPSQIDYKTVVVQQIIDSVTQTRQTVFPNVQTFKQDETYTQVIEQLKTQIESGYQIVSVVKQNYGQNKQVSILLKNQDTSPRQIQLNINSFNNEIIVLQNKTIVSQLTEDGFILQKEIPKPYEFKISSIDEQKFEIITKISGIKQQDNFKTVEQIKILQKNDLFNKADTYLKTQFQSILQQSNIVHISTKQTLDTEQYKVYYMGTQKNDKQIYQAKIKLNTITQAFEILDFSKIGATKPQKSKLNVGSDIAYGYEQLQDFSNDKNLDFIVQQAKKHFVTLVNAVIQSVQVLSLCNRRFNYKIFFKNGLQIVKYIVYYEEAFKRVIFLQGKQFSFGGSNYETVYKQDLVTEGYFKNVNQYLKYKNAEISQGSEVVLVEREDRGKDYNYRVIYSKDGKTYHASSTIDKDLLNIDTQYFNQIIQIPVIRQQQSLIPISTEEYATLKINDLTHNSNFEKVHRQILSKQGSFLQNAQLAGAQQKSFMFKIQYIFFFLINKVYYKIEAEIDSTNKKVQIITDLEKVNTDTGYSVETDSNDSEDIINWVQKINPDLNSGVIMEISSKKQIFGTIYKLLFKLQTKYYQINVYKQGKDFKILSQSQFTSLDSSAPTIRPFPRPIKQERLY